MIVRKVLLFLALLIEDVRLGIVWFIDLALGVKKIEVLMTYVMTQSKEEQLEMLAGF